MPNQCLNSQGEATPPVRAFRLTLLLDADTREELASALKNMAWHIVASEISTGVSGGPCSGSIYELLHDPSQTHDAYHAQLREYLRKKGFER